MAFNANGDLLVSQEGGPMMLVRKSADGKFETVSPYCEEVRNIQGILPIGSRVYAVGDGPEGGALYQITDSDGRRINRMRLHAPEAAPIEE